MLFEEEQTKGEAGDKFNNGNLRNDRAAGGKDTVHNISDSGDQTAVHRTIEHCGQKYRDEFQRDFAYGAEPECAEHRQQGGDCYKKT